jgi:hypothetical protein
MEALPQTGLDERVSVAPEKRFLVSVCVRTKSRKFSGVVLAVFLAGLGFWPNQATGHQLYQPYARVYTNVTEGLRGGSNDVLPGRPNASRKWPPACQMPSLL